MKFTALKTDKVAFDGINIHQFAEGEDYVFDGEQLTRLQELGVAPKGKAKADGPDENKALSGAPENKGEPKLSDLTVAQLTEKAKELGIELAGRERKADLIAAIEAAQAAE